MKKKFFEKKSEFKCDRILNAHNFHHYEFLLVPSYKFSRILSQTGVISL